MLSCGIMYRTGTQYALPWNILLEAHCVSTDLAEEATIYLQKSDERRKCIH